MHQLISKCQNIIEEFIPQAGAKELIKLFSCLDLTDLSALSTKEDIQLLCEKVKDIPESYPLLTNNVAAVCLYPANVAAAKEKLKGTAIQIATVTGGFPHAQMLLELKVSESVKAKEMGADEIDMVLNLGAFLGKDQQKASDEIRSIKNAIGTKKLKVILEVSLLNDHKKTEEAAKLAIDAGADFIKTSTGKDGSVADYESVYIMCTSILDYYKQTGKKIGIKPAGGIRKIKDALGYYGIIQSVLGEEWINPEVFRLGASSLANVILQTLYPDNANRAYF